MDDGGALSLKTQFVLIKNGKHERQIEDSEKWGRGYSNGRKLERSKSMHYEENRCMGTEW